ncbi:FA complementation group M [Arctopsyche grandis]|uniref:FA complementation group M n=1 Tax=Arctopsyche grandis TaxID=121162 RepID=UPI00406DA26E
MDDADDAAFLEASLLDISALCCDEEFVGFDKNNGNTWIYPTNYSVRDYQFNIVKTSLFKNTLVSLPTGLGKTFIAAVVMCNYYRWYPMGKIIFVAPTRPLVAQQIDACYNIMAIPPEDTIEMTGTMPVAARKIAWKQKRVIFATPQVVQNDLESGSCPGELVRCLVIDEAHRAKGRHSYCQLVELLAIKEHKLYRILALSATPGSKVEDVIHVVQNLKISHLELRTEECIDVAMYSHSRNIQTVVVPLGNDLNAVRNQFIEILDIYTRRLVQCKVLTGNIGALSKGRIIMLFKEYQTKEKSLRHPQHKFIMLDFTMVITLYHALELLTRHGARVFLNFFDEHTDKTWVGKDDRLVYFLERLRDDLGVNPMSIDRSTLPDGTIPEIKENLIFGHPKFDHLKSIMLEHFNTAKYKGQETKAIIFCEYRESVNLVHCLLLQCRPLIKPNMFIGQGAGSGGKDSNLKPFSQKQQLKVMQLFREGVCNVLISTCVGEEGLDVGNVDLIICFDISNKSPVRLVQRCGRTGRERNGRVVILVTEGKEHQTLRDCMYERDNLNKRILHSKEIQKCLYTGNPRMIPQNIKPVCQKMFITVQKKQVVEKGNQSKKVQSKLKDIFGKTKNENNVEIKPALISKEEFLSTYGESFNMSKYFVKELDCFDTSKVDFLNSANVDISIENPGNLLSKRTEWQRILQNTCEMGHSVNSEIFTKLLQFADSKRFDIQSTCDANICPPNLDFEINTVPNAKKIIAPKKREKVNASQKPKNNNDIRQLFRKINRANNKEETLFKDRLDEILNECGIDTSTQESINDHLKLENIPFSLVDLMVELDIGKSKLDSVMEYTFPELTLIKAKASNLSSAILPNYKLDDSLCLSSLNLNSSVDMKIDVSLVLSPKSDNSGIEDFDMDQFDIAEHNVNFDDHSFHCEINDTSLDAQKNCQNNDSTKRDNFNVIDVDGIFDESNFAFSDTNSPKNANLECNMELKRSSLLNDTKNPLEFFGLGGVEDIFASNSFDESTNESKISSIKSPILDRNINIEQDSTSPIIMTQRDRKSRMSNAALIPKILNGDDDLRLRLNDTKFNIQSNINLSLHTPKRNLNQTFNDCNESTLLSITQAINMINNKDKTDLDMSKSDDGNESSHSIILCSQVAKPKMFKTKKTLSQLKPNIVILASSESSDDSLDIKSSNEIRNVDNDLEPFNNSNDIKTNSTVLRSETASPSLLNRIVFNSDEASPFFPSSVNTFKNTTSDNKHKSIKEKLDYSLSLGSDFSFSSKENVCPDDNEQVQVNLVQSSSNHTVNSIHQLSAFARKSKTTMMKHNVNRSNSSLELYKNSEDSDDDFFTKSPRKPIFEKKRNTEVNKNKAKKKKKKLCEFIDYEAILSDDSYEGGSSEHDSEGSNTTLGSFICDENADLNESIDMRAKYLQSVKSPLNGKFKIPQLPKINANVFSQADPDQDASYELDSFCVGNEQLLTQAQDLSELEIAEAILKKRKRRRVYQQEYSDDCGSSNSELNKSHTSEDSPVNQNKNKRAKMRINSDSSSDESSAFV